MSDSTPTSSTGQAPPLPECIKDPWISRSGWERVQAVLRPTEQGMLSEEVVGVVKSAATGLLLGWLYGGIPAARHSKESFIHKSQAEVYEHRVDAVRSSHHAALRGFVRYGWRWGWRVCMFVTIFNSVSTGISVYRDDVSLSHFAAAGAVTGGLFRLNLGLRGLLGGSVIGTALGFPAGAMISWLQTLTGESIRVRKRREEEALYLNQVEEWNARLGITEGVLQEIGAAQVDSAETDAERIDKLLQLKRNPVTEREEER
uniref:Complex I assembly factor TIMMDC1, mitochondrial n=1 Tax=Leptobrachium leishanense TaxID=445787 RepID=A0A8C5QSJ2_9ANUR